MTAHPESEFEAALLLTSARVRCSGAQGKGLCASPWKPAPFWVPNNCPAAAQVNKNVLLKGRVGTDAAVASFSFKAWWQPSFTIGASAGYDMQTRKPVFGFVLNCENYGNIR